MLLIEPIEDIFANMEKIFIRFKADPIYFHLHIVLEFLRYEYYDHYKLYRKAEKFFEEVDDSISSLLSSYNGYTYGAQFLFSKLNRHFRIGTMEGLHEENLGLFHDFEPDVQNIPQYITYIGYRAISAYYAGKLDEGIRLLNKLLNEVNLKKYPYFHLDIKLLLAVFYAIVQETDLLNQSLGSMQRQVRILSKETCFHAVQLMKVLKLSIYEPKLNEAETAEKNDKIKMFVEKLRKMAVPTGFSLVRYLKFDEAFASKFILLNK